MLRQLDNLGKVCLVVQCLLLALKNQGIQQFRHLLVVFRVDRPLVDDEATDVVFNRLGHCVTVLTQPARQRIDRRFATLDNQLHERHIVEGRELFTVLGPDIRVEQVAHGRLVHFHVDIVAAGKLDLLPHLLVVVHFGFDFLCLDSGVAGLTHLVGQVGVSAQERRGQLVECHTLRFVVFELLLITTLGGAKEAQIRRSVAWRLNRLAQRLDRLACLL